MKLSTLLSAVLKLLILGIALGKKNLRLNVQHQSASRKLTNFDCLLLIKTVHYENHDEKTVLDCQINGSPPLSIVNIPSWLNEKFQRDEINSNRDILKISQALVSSEGIYIPTGAQTSIIKDSNRRRLVTSGEKSIIAMRVSVDGLADPSLSLAEFSDSIFGTDTDEFNLVSGFASCSYNKLTFTNGIGQDIVDGMLDVDVGSVTNDDDIIWQAALATKGWSFSNKPPYDHVSIRIFIFENIAAMFNLSLNTNVDDTFNLRP